MYVFFYVFSLTAVRLGFQLAEGVWGGDRERTVAESFPPWYLGFRTVPGRFSIALAC